MKLDEIPLDPDCGARHLGRCGGISFRDRLASVEVSERGFETVERHNYYDRVALDEAFGPDRREQMLEETRGLGAIQRADDGSEWVYDDPTTREMRPLESSDLRGGYLRGQGD